MLIKELRARLEAIVARQKEITADDAPSAELEAEFDALSEEFDQVTAKISRLERLEANATALEGATGRVTSPPEPTDRNRITGGRERVEDDPMRGFESMADMALAVRAACEPGGDVDPRLRVLGAPSNTHVESGSDGFMVAPAMRDSIWDEVFDDSEFNLLDAVDPEPTDSNSVQLLADESTPWGSTGIQARWGAEGGQLQRSRLSTDGRQVRLHKLHAFVEASDELVSDASLLSSRLTRGAGRAIRWKGSDAIIHGTGAGMPLGFLAADALVTVAKESGQAADTINVENVSKMRSRLLGSGAGAFWLANSDTLPQLITLAIGDQPIWTPPNAGLQNAPGGFLLGLPVQFAEHAKTVGDKGDLSLVDPAGYYALTKRGGMKFASSIHLFFDYDVECFRWTFRLGGQPFLSAPVTPPNSSNTKSHFVALAART